MSSHANDIVAHYRSKGLEGDALSAAVERHRRILTADPDVVPDLEVRATAFPRKAEQRFRSQLEARWEQEASERLERMGSRA